MHRCLALLAFVFLLSSPAHSSQIFSGLSASQQQELQKGRLVSIPETIAGKPWPRVVVYAFIPAEPSEVMAVFANYASAQSYIPNVVASRVTKTFFPWDTEVSYELDIPILPNEKYTARNVLSKSKDGSRLTATWTAGDAKYFTSSVGNIAVEAWNNGTLVRYTNLVDPGTRIAGLLKGHAQRQVEETVSAICARVMELKTKNPALLEKKVKALNAALSGSPR